MEKFANDVLYSIDHMEPRHWIFVLAAAIAIGLACLKGFGTRTP
jgi:hypothetical protein